LLAICPYPDWRTCAIAIRAELRLAIFEFGLFDLGVFQMS